MKKALVRTYNFLICMVVANPAISFIIGFPTMPFNFELGATIVGYGFAISIIYALIFFIFGGILYTIINTLYYFDSDIEIDIGSVFIKLK
ncbi:hypothetical protein [Helicobacter sp. 12S02634-8]|uniref:hypothetical protein n=1 Tax=Helicobacter sp. 12S02634-8 TaxID=1476199 RepID=UPI00117ABCC4|nr:hypothetical protein [Helicobacter sp. 12S02634-8]